MHRTLRHLTTQLIVLGKHQSTDWRLGALEEQGVTYSTIASASDSINPLICILILYVSGASSKVKGVIFFLPEKTVSLHTFWKHNLLKDMRIIKKKKTSTEFICMSFFPQRMEHLVNE